MRSRSQAKTAIILGFILLMGVAFKFFMGMDKVEFTIFTDVDRYPSNIARDTLSILAWFLVVERFRVHKVISAPMFWAFTAVLIAQTLDYFLVGGKFGGWRLLIFPITYLSLIAWKRK